MLVLDVEDERKVAAFIKAGLEERGFSAEVSGDGDDAVLFATSRPFDAIVLDIMLPGRDGLSVLRKLRAEHHTMPVLLLSAGRP